MSVDPDLQDGRAAFVAQLAVICDLDPETIAGEARLATDLGMDSPAVAEFVVLVFERFGVDLGDRGFEWLDLTVDELYHELRRSSPGHDRPAFTR